MVESQASASNTIRSVPPGPIARCWSTVMGIGPVRYDIRVAIVIADDEQPAGVQIKAIDVPVGPNQVAVVRVIEIDERSPRIRASKVGPRQRGGGEERICKFWPAKLPPARLFAPEAYPTQIMGLVACC